MTHAQITLRGMVQGVGFRPFIFRLARQHGVTGYVTNTTPGVLIEAEGRDRAVSAFIRDLTHRKPPLVSIDDLQIRTTLTSGQSRFRSFRITASLVETSGTGLLPPDLDVCPRCLTELFTTKDRRHHYPFINCTECGPRYSIIEGLPYDRPQTSMKDFPLCSSCAEEYGDPGSRRFHAQANSCPRCGPQLEFADWKGRPDSGSDPIGRAAALLVQGCILAVKGLGGFHLAVDACSQEAVARLRQRKNRPHKPMAVMVADVPAARRFADISAAEVVWLSGREKPIVLLRRSRTSTLAANLAPGQRFIGMMLPYTPLHHLLLAAGPFPALVMTSGNHPGEPMAKDNHEAADRLSGIADGFLWHNRPIVVRNDDSVLRLSGDVPVFLRRSRSFAPLPLLLNRNAGCTLALGGSEKNTICLTRGRRAFLSQHLGDLDSPGSLANYRFAIDHLQKTLQIKPELVAHDLHPDYPSSRYAAALNLPRIGVQHHHAHAVSCMAEHNLPGPVLAVVLDGSGLGTDGTIWGGEVLFATLSRSQRLAHFRPFPMPGGELAIRQPWRSAIALLHLGFGIDLLQLGLPLLQKHQNALPIILQMMTKGVNSPLTSSCGRLFDAAAALIGLRETITYEGQAAVELEMLITGTRVPAPYPYILEPRAGCWQIDPGPMFREIVADLTRGLPAAAISNRFHQSLAVMLHETCRRLRKAYKIHQVALSGGVFQNLILRSRLHLLLTADGFRVYHHRKVPPNDGGLALGQAVAGWAMAREGNRDGMA